MTIKNTYQIGSLIELAFSAAMIRDFWSKSESIKSNKSWHPCQYLIFKNNSQWLSPPHLLKIRRLNLLSPLSSGFVKLGKIKSTEPLLSSHQLDRKIIYSEKFYWASYKVTDHAVTMVITWVGELKLTKEGWYL